MSSGQVQDYIDLLIDKHNILGEHYVVRQLAWAVAELERVQGHQVDDERCYECSGTGERDGEECPFCLGTGFPRDMPYGDGQ